LGEVTAQQAVEKHKVVMDKLEKIEATLTPPKAPTILGLVKQLVRESEDHMITYLEEVDCGSIMAFSADHTFKVAKQIKDKDIAGLFSIWNGDGIPIIQFWCEDLTVKSLKPALEQLKIKICKELAGKGLVFEEATIPFTIDNCCSFGPQIVQCLSPLNIIIKLDFFHWMARWGRKNALLSHPCGQPFLALVRDVYYTHCGDQANLESNFRDLENHSYTKKLMDEISGFKSRWNIQMRHVYNGKRCLVQEDMRNLLGGIHEHQRLTVYGERYHRGLNECLCERSGVTFDTLQCKTHLYNYKLAVNKERKRSGVLRKKPVLEQSLLQKEYEMEKECLVVIKQRSIFEREKQKLIAGFTMPVVKKDHGVCEAPAFQHPGFGVAETTQTIVANTQHTKDLNDLKLEDVEFYTAKAVPDGSASTCKKFLTTDRADRLAHMALKCLADDTQLIKENTTLRKLIPDLGIDDEELPMLNDIIDTNEDENVADIESPSLLQKLHGFIIAKSKKSYHNSFKDYSNFLITIDEPPYFIIVINALAQLSQCVILWAHTIATGNGKLQVSVHSPTTTEVENVIGICPTPGGYSFFDPSKTRVALQLTELDPQTDAFVPMEAQTTEEKELEAKRMKAEETPTATAPAPAPEPAADTPPEAGEFPPIALNQKINTHEWFLFTFLCGKAAEAGIACTASSSKANELVTYAFQQYEKYQTNRSAEYLSLSKPFQENIKRKLTSVQLRKRWDNDAKMMKTNALEKDKAFTPYNGLDSGTFTFADVCKKLYLNFFNSDKDLQDTLAKKLITQAEKEEALIRRPGLSKKCQEHKSKQKSET
jgi:hypothetical protein